MTEDMKTKPETPSNTNQTDAAILADDLPRPNRHTRRALKKLFKNVIIANERGGAGKTFLAQLMASLAKSHFGNVTVLEVDDQDLLVKLFPGEAQKVAFAKVEDTRRDFTADIRALDPVLKALTDPDGPPAIVDLGARQDQRFARAMSKSNIARYVAASGRDTAILVPVLPDEDTIRCAVRTTRRLAVCLPEASIFICCRLMTPGGLNKAAQELWDERLAPIIAENGSLQIPTFEYATVQQVERLGRSMFDLSHMQIAELAGMLEESVFITEVIREDMHLNVEQWREQLVTKGFFA